MIKIKGKNQRNKNQRNNAKSMKPKVGFLKGSKTGNSLARLSN